MPVESGYDADMMWIDSDGTDLWWHMPQVREGYGTVIHWPRHPKVAQEGGTPLGVPVQANLGRAHAVVGPRPADEDAGENGRPVGVRRGNVVPFPVVVTDDDLRAVWMVQVMAMAGMTVGLGRRNHTQDE